jgi:N-carbamoylputrescine amidase
MPELFLSQYFCQTESVKNFDLAEAVPGPTSMHFEKLAAELNVSFVLSLFEKRTEGVYHNTACVIDPEKGYLGKYRKMHIPDDPLYLEKFYFTPGDLGVKVFETAGLKVGVLICWDQWFPEAARLAALKGAQVLVYPTAIGWHLSEKDSHGAGQLSSWQTIQRSHAVANGVYVVAINRTGFEPTSEGDQPPDGIQFWGQSFIAGPNGVPRVQAGETEECVIMTDFDLAALREQRHGWPFLRDRRVDQYGGITKLFDDGSE